MVRPGPDWLIFHYPSSVQTNFLRPLCPRFQLSINFSATLLYVKLCESLRFSSPWSRSRQMSCSWNRSLIDLDSSPHLRVDRSSSASWNDRTSRKPHACWLFPRPCTQIQGSPVLKYRIWSCFLVDSGFKRSAFVSGSQIWQPDSTLNRGSSFAIRSIRKPTIESVVLLHRILAPLRWSVEILGLLEDESETGANVLSWSDAGVPQSSREF